VLIASCKLLSGSPTRSLLGKFGQCPWRHSCKRYRFSELVSSVRKDSVCSDSIASPGTTGRQRATRPLLPSLDRETPAVLTELSRPSVPVRILLRLALPNCVRIESAEHVLPQKSRHRWDDLPQWWYLDYDVHTGWSKTVHWFCDHAGMSLATHAVLSETCRVEERMTTVPTHRTGKSLDCSRESFQRKTPCQIRVLS